MTTASDPLAAIQKRTLVGSRLRKHADYQVVYKSSRKQFSSLSSYFVRLRAPEESATIEPGPRIGLTVGRVMGKAVVRNRIKRRMREALRLNLSALSADVDLVFHPKKTVATVEFPTLEKDVLKVLTAAQQLAGKLTRSQS